MNKQSIYDIVSEIYQIMQNQLLLLEIDITENYLTIIKNYIDEGYNLFRFINTFYSIKKTIELESFISKVYNRKDKGLFPSVVLYNGIVNENSFEDLLYVFYKFFNKKNDFYLICNDKTMYFSIDYRCQFCDLMYDFPKIKSQLFSFNLPSGACKICRGAGIIVENYENLDSEWFLNKEKRNVLIAKVQD